MNRIVWSCSIIAGLVAGCGNGGGGSSGGTSEGTTGGATGSSGGAAGSGTGGASSSGSSGGLYNTLTGTFTSALVQATFSGTFEGNHRASSGITWETGTTFELDGEPQGTPAPVITVPAGETGKVSFKFYLLPDAGLPEGGTFTTCGLSPGEVLAVFDIGTVGHDPVAGSYGSGSPGATCSLTLDAPTEVGPVNGGSYFAHGSITATLTGGATLPDGGADQGTLSATW